MNKTAGVNEMVHLPNGNVMVNGVERTKREWLKMTRRERDLEAAAYAWRLASLATK